MARKDVETVPASFSTYVDRETAAMLVELQRSHGNASRSLVIRALIRKEATGGKKDLGSWVAELRSSAT